MTDRSRPMTTAERQRKRENGLRAAGLVQRKRWAHADDWPEIDALIDRLNSERENG